MVDPTGVDGRAPVAQSYQERRPAPSLAGIVSSVWIHQVSRDAAPYTQRNVPNGCVELLCRVGSAPQVIGPLTGPALEVLPPGTTVVGLRFRPGGAAGVLGLPASELVDLAMDARELWGDPVDALGDVVASSASPHQALAHLQRYVAGRMAGAADPDPAVDEAVRRLRHWRAGEVGTLGSLLCLSERQFRRRCQSAVGVAPKVLHGLLRFQRFLAQAQFALSRGRSPSGSGLATLAAEAGYADQAHLTRECVRLTGATPRAFLGQIEQDCGCGHDHEVSFAPMLDPQPVPG